MKKTLHTLLTAAAFAAVMGSSNIQTAFAEDGYQPENPQINYEYDPAKDEPQDVYGPPSWFGQTTETTAPLVETLTTTTQTATVMVYGPPAIMSSLFSKTTVTSTDDIITTTTTALPQIAYGPPWMFYPRGDMNLDFEIDVTDLAAMKKMLIGNINNYDEERLADVNNDGEFNIADVVSMQNFLLGRTSNYSLTDEQVPNVEAYLKSTSGSVQPDYGVLDEKWNAVKDITEK